MSVAFDVQCSELHVPYRGKNLTFRDFVDKTATISLLL